MPNRLAGGPQSSSDDLYTKIALDNKLITRYHLRQASKEQEDLAAQGEQLDLGAILVRMGFLTDGQHQSVLNACRYREQRDYDKRFARQILRMELLPQSKIEEALEIQKTEYGQSGVVTPLADTLAKAGTLDAEQVEAVHKGIQQRDQARHRNPTASQRPLAVSGPTPVLPPRGGEDDPTVEAAPLNARQRPTEDADEGDLDDADLDDEDLDLDDEDLGDLDEGDLDDADLDDLDDEDLDLDDEDLGDLDDADLDDADLDDADLESALGAVEAAPASGAGDSDLGDLDEADLDSDLGDLDEADLDSDLGDVDDADLDSDLGDLDDVDLDDDDLDDVDLDDDDLDDVDLDDDADDAAPVAAAPEDLDEEGSDLAALNLDDLDERALEAPEGDDEDEDDLAEAASELDSEVELDEEDLRAIEELGSAEELVGAAGWAAEAFDDRPLGMRPPSERLDAIAPSSLAAPTPPAPPAPRAMPKPPAAPRPPARPAAPPAPVAPAARAVPAPSGIPGGSVLDENLSDLGKTESEELRPAPAPTDMGRVEDFGDLIESADAGAAPPDEPSDFGSQDLLDPREVPSEERRAMIESAMTGAVERALASSGEELRPEPSPAASAGFDPQDPRVRAAFERAVQRAISVAYEAFVAELNGAANPSRGDV